MNYYAIGIGGTGAKFIESLVHLSAAGLMPSGNLYILFVDPDGANGSLARARETLENYIECHGIQRGGIDLFKTKITRFNPDFWSPFANVGNPNLCDFFLYNNMEQGEKDLFDVLYSDSEKDTNLNMGFRGHPSIGAAVMAKTVNLGNAEPWMTFRQKVANDVQAGTGARIFLCGSIFGGTGASGFPTIARLIRDELPRIGNANVRLGGALILPYFSFTPGDSRDLRASSENFQMNTQVALKYYHQQRAIDIFDAIYILGDESRASVDFSLGGSDQKNDPHFVELYVGLAGINFFGRNNFDNRKYIMIARNDRHSMKWDDLPNWENVKKKIDQLTRFAFAYLHVYYPTLQYIKRGNEWTVPWYIDLFKRNNTPINDQGLSQVKDYCEKFLNWLACIQHSAIVNIKEDDKNGIIELINYLAFAEVGKDKRVALMDDHTNFKNEEFYNLILPEGKEYRNALSKLWEYMCGAKVKDQTANGFGKFINALYTQCGKFVT